MTEARTLVQEAVTQGLLGPEVLLPEEPSAPPGYQLVRRLGRGGCGEVYLARETGLDRPVAIKFLTNASPGDVERFRREARFAARLADPAFVQVYALGEHEGRPWIAMQYVNGRNLADAGLDTAGTVRAVAAVARALRQAHAAGIVHRDIKPANILLDREGRAYLTDFGIARSLGGDLGETISRHGQIMGTPALMPPEQARGDIEAVDARSDIYALGATLFCKLAGRYPFEADNLVDVLHAVIHEPPPLVRTWNVSVPRDLEAIVFRCMQKAREDRYQSVEELVAELDRFLAGGHAGRESSAWFRRLVGELHGAPSPSPTGDGETDAWWTVGLETVREIASWDADLYRVSGSLARSLARLDSIRGRLDAILAVRPEVAWARFYRGAVHFRRGRLTEAREDMERAIDRVRNLASAYFELGRLYLSLYLREHRAARRHLSQVGVADGLESARSLLEEAAVALREAQRLGGDVPAWIEGCVRAVTRLAESDHAGCAEECERALAEEPDVELLWKLRGDAQRLAGQDPFDSYERALRVRRSYFEALYATAEAHLERGRIEEARAALERARAIHPEFADGVALQARTHLVEARRGGPAAAAALAAGVELAEEALRLDDRHYDAAVTAAELRIEQARIGGRDEPLGTALGLLEVAAGLEGCGNRVNLLRATARLERARLQRARGEDPRRELGAVMDFCRHEAAQVTDNAPWERIRLQAEAELARA